MAVGCSWGQFLSSISFCPFDGGISSIHESDVQSSHRRFAVRDNPIICFDLELLM